MGQQHEGSLPGVDYPDRAVARAKNPNTGLRLFIATSLLGAMAAGGHALLEDKAEQPDPTITHQPGRYASWFSVKHRPVADKRLAAHLIYRVADGAGEYEKTGNSSPDSTVAVELSNCSMRAGVNPEQSASAIYTIEHVDPGEIVHGTFKYLAQNGALDVCKTATVGSFTPEFERGEKEGIVGDAIRFVTPTVLRAAVVFPANYSQGLI